MKRQPLILLGLFLYPFSVHADLFAPGNIIFTDPFYSPDGQIVELKVTGNEAEIVNVVRWELGDADRRRALGLDIDPAGTVFVGITAAFDPAPDNPYPEGIGEILRIDNQGKQTFYITDIIKVTLLAVTGTDEVIVNSNAADANKAYGYKLGAAEIASWTEFEKTSYGEALKLPDGRILMGDNGVPGIHIYDAAGGAPSGVFSQAAGADGNGRAVRSLTYNEKMGALVALLQDQHTLLRINMNGEIEEEYNASADGFTALWGVAQIPGTTEFIVGNHDVAATANTFGIFDALNLAAGARLITITSGFERAGLDANTQFRSFFNMAVVPGAEIPVRIDDWELHE
ncbi:MAG: hypothetical protein ACE15F_20670 [bacterium]